MKHIPHFNLHRKKNQRSSKTRHRLLRSPWVWSLIASAIAATLLFYIDDQKETQQSLTYFPEDPNLYFVHKKTELSLKTGENGPPSLDWTVTSLTNQPTYLRQDVSLLFKDGVLISLLSEWKQATADLVQKKKIPVVESSYFQALTVHHAEIHYGDDTIKGKEAMSYDHLFVVASPYNHLFSFQIPVTPAEQDWHKLIESAQSKKRQTILKKAEKKYHINPENYDIFPLTYLHIFDHNPLPGLSKKTSHRAISQLWEGLYKGYVLGISESESQMENPIGSSMPIILYSKKGDHFLVVIQTVSGRLVLLKQLI